MRGWLCRFTTSKLILEVLKDGNEHYSWEIHKTIMDKLKQILDEKIYKYKLPTHQSVASILRVCHKLGLVEKVREDTPMKKGYYKRVYYKLSKPDAIEWENPIFAYYYPEKFKITRKSEEEKRNWVIENARRMRNAKVR